MSASERSATTLDEIITLVNSDANLNQISVKIRRCPQLADALLAQANSIELALQHQISSVEHAITLLGRRRVAETIARVTRYDGRSSPRPHR